ncbi:MAG: hypothetical protein KA184_12130 [Candidatus Hydrogenedentes bacterium]|nr:hypothetical protein [Candidatus Hydrogenedentota bacterium]
MFFRISLHGLLGCLLAIITVCFSSKNTSAAEAVASAPLSAPGDETAGGWVKCPENPVLGDGLGTCFDICVHKEADLFRTWFSWRPKAAIALVESKDGVHWSEPVIVLGPNSETDWEDEVNRPCVLKRYGRYHMWYTGQADDHSWIGYATSPDGVTWTRMSATPVLAPERAWENVALMCPHVLWDAEQGVYRMWYSGGGQYEPDAIGYATSADGIKWDRLPENPIFRPEPGNDWEKDRVTACQVVRDGDWHVMFYIGFRDIDHAAIGIARSRDGIRDWQRLPANPVIRPGLDKWDAEACYKPYAILDGNRWMLGYNGRTGRIEQIGLATHEGPELGFP